MRLLVLTAFYPVPNGTHERMFVHVRNQYYASHGMDVTVLNFAAKADYRIDGIRVITLASYEKGREDYDIALIHSANVRNHYRFLKRYQARFPRLVFFFHGHEVLYLHKDYPQPYAYSRAANPVRMAAQTGYDHLKLALWRRYYPRLAPKSEFVFVSQWLRSRFLRNLDLPQQALLGHLHVIYNSIGSFFETASYAWQGEKQYDFIVIRSNLDGSKYCVDLVTELARANPELKFLVIGKGDYYVHNEKPANVHLVHRTVDHRQMQAYLDDSRCALMLTRQDTQGVMACELAAYGIPVISSDIPVCREILGEVPNVALISNDVTGVDLVQLRDRLAQGLPYPKNRTYFGENTIRKELQLFRREPLGDV